MEAWVEREIAGGDFPDRRLKTRLSLLLTELGRHVGETIPTACQNWAATKAAYRFFDNDRVDESVILTGHFQATKIRFAQTRGPVLIIQDTTDFSFQRNRPETIGQTRVIALNKDKRPITTCGLLMHASLVVTPEGLPLGLAAIKFWTRKKFKGTNALKKKVNPTRIPIEQKESYRWLENLRQSTRLLAAPARCVHVGDRESDIYELFCEAKKLGTRFLVRTCVDRLAGSGRTTISKKMKREQIRGVHQVLVRNREGQLSQAKLRVRFCQMTVHAPIGKNSRYSPLLLTIIYADECGQPADRDPIHWKLAPNLRMKTLSAAIEKLDWYAQRWKIEVSQAECVSRTCLSQLAA